MCGGLGAKPPICVCGACFCKPANRFVVVWAPTHPYVCGGLGAKPQLCVWCVWAQTTTIIVAVWEPNHHICLWWSGSQTTFGGLCFCCFPGGLAPKPQLFYRGLAPKPPHTYLWFGSENHPKILVVCEPNHRTHSGEVGQTTTKTVVVCAPNHNKNSCGLGPKKPPPDHHEKE